MAMRAIFRIGSLLLALLAAGSASAGPIFRVDRPSVAFADQPVGIASTPETLTLTNAGDGFLVVGVETLLDGPNGTDFRVREDNNNCLGPTAGFTLGPKAVCRVTLEFLPASQGAKNAAL